MALHGPAADIRGCVETFHGRCRHEAQLLALTPHRASNDAVVDEVKAWQARPLDPVYPIVYLDCIHVKVREGAVRVIAVYLAIGVTMAGEKEVLGLWLAQAEGAKFWLQVVTELRNRGV